MAVCVLVIDGCGRMGLMKTEDDLAIVVAKLWFKYLGLVGMMAGMRWVEIKTGDYWMGNVNLISTMMAWSYFESILCRPDGWFMGRFSKRWWGKLCGLILGGAMASSALMFSMHLVAVLVQAK